tara:strand:+ start:156 stop:698 length:543 start_codon:yes stop_codon:yes gene_type:complete
MPFTPGIKTAYKLSNCDGTMTYIGVSGNMKQRLYTHRNWKWNMNCTSCIFKGIFEVEELESYPCETHKEQSELERYYFDIYAETNVNKCTPGQTKAEYNATPKHKAAQTAYEATAERKAVRAAYRATPKRKAYLKKYNAKPEVKIAKAAYNKAYKKERRDKKEIESVMNCMLDTLEAMHT